jgi:hypothetical protein
MKRSRVSRLRAPIIGLAICALVLGALALAAPRAGAIAPKQLANKVLRFDPRKPADINLFTSVFEFDGQKAKSMVPDPTLRASFVGMRGTLLEPTINRLLNGLAI